MYGAAPVVPSPLDFMDPRSKSDFEAGLLAFHAVTLANPDLTWDDVLQQGFFMEGCGTKKKCGYFDLWCKSQNLAVDACRAAGAVKDGVGDVLRDVSKVTGERAGEAIRLASDPKVADTISRAAQAYATGGGSEGARGFFASLGSIFSPTGQQAVSNTGAAYKASFGLDFRNPWVIGIAVAGGLFLVTRFAAPPARR